MKLIRTAKILIKNKDLYPNLSQTLFAYTLAFNYVCSIGYPKRITNGITLHKKTYYSAREFLPSQLAISSRMKATEAIKSIKKKPKAACPNSKKCSIRYDQNSYTLFKERNEVSLLTLNGRIKFKLDIPNYYKQYFTWKNTSADLAIDKKGRFWLHIVFEKDINDPIVNSNFVGIDRGENNIAVSSNNQFYSGGHVKKVCSKYNRLRSNLQKASDNGSRSAKRHLSVLKGREKRFKKDINHVISKQIISSLKSGDSIILEDLTNIRSTAKRRKEQRRQFHSWSFYQLELFLIYKAAEAGINVFHVDARYTSQKCSCCGHIDKKNRKGSNFCCLACNFQLHADLNAARNIRNNYLKSYKLLREAEVNQPDVSDFSEAEIGFDPPTASAVGS